MVRTKMAQRDRAKQFMPFAALKGYPEALLEKERFLVPKKELAEEYQEEINRKLLHLTKDDIARVAYFCKGEYKEVTDFVTRIDKTSKLLKIGNTEIPFEDIYDIGSDDRKQEERE